MASMGTTPSVISAELRQPRKDAAAVDRGDVQIGVRDLDGVILRDDAAGYLARAGLLHLNLHLLEIIGHLDDQILQIQDDVADVFDHAFDDAEFVDGTVKLDLGHGGAGDG